MYLRVELGCDKLFYTVGREISLYSLTFKAWVPRQAGTAEAVDVYIAGDTWKEDKFSQSLICKLT